MTTATHDTTSGLPAGKTPGAVSPDFPTFSPWLHISLNTLAYFTSQELAFLFPDAFGVLAAIWPAAGIALAALLLSPRRIWPRLLGCLFVAGLAANFTTNRPLLASVGFMVANIGETAATAWLITRLCGSRVGFATVKEVSVLVVCALLVNSVTAALGAGFACFASGAQFAKFYWTWWVADGLGLLLITPLIVNGDRGWRAWVNQPFRRRAEAICLIALGCAVAVNEFGSHREFASVELAPFWLPVFLIWSALRCGPLVSIILLAGFSFVAVGCTAAGLGNFPLGGADETLRLLAVQVYLGVMGISGMVLAAAIAQQREMQALLHAVVEGTSDAIYVKDREGRYLLFNSAAARFVGKPAAAVLGRDDTFLFPTADAQAVMKGDQVTMAGDGPRTYGEHLTIASGEAADFLSTKGPLRDETGALVGLFGIARNVTAQKRVEAALRVSEEKFAKVFRQAPVLIVLADMAEGRCIDVNDEVVRVSGFSREEIIGHTTIELGWLSVEERDRLVQGVLKNGRVDDLPMKLRTKSGERRDGLVSCESMEIGGQPFLLSVTVDVTESRQTEAALRKSEEKLRALFDTMAEGTALNEIVYDAEGAMIDYRIIEVNQAFYAVADFEPGQVIGNVASKLYGMSAAAIASFWAAHQRRDEVLHSEMESPRTKKHYLISTSPFVNGRFVTTFFDITELKRSEEALRKSDVRYRQFERAVNDGLWEWDPFQQKSYLSPRWKEILGLQDVDPAGEEEVFFGRVHPDDQALVAEAIRRHLEERARFQVEMRLRHQDGSYRWVLSRGEAIRDASGHPIRMVGAITDITAHKQAEAAREEALNRLRKIAEQVPGMVYQFRLRPDGSACLPYASEGIRDLYGVGPEEVAEDAGKIFACNHPDDRAGIFASIQKSAEHMTPWLHEYRLKYPDGTVRWVAGNALPQREDDGTTLWHGFVTDVTERKQAEHALQASLHEKEALLKEVHHRVKNNLQVITSLLRLEAGRSDLPVTKSVLEDMQGRIRSMAMLHEALYRSGTFAAVDLGTYLKQITTQLFRALVPATGAVQLQLDLSPAPVDMDQAMPCGLLINELVSNALKHAFPPGRSGLVRVALHRVNGGPLLRLEVSDNGVGLPVDAVLRPHRTLGMQLVGDLTRQIEGTLETGPGPGTCFTITFTPRLSAAGLPVAPPALRL